MSGNKYVSWVNEWRFNIYCESWTILLCFKRKWLLKNCLYCSLFIYVSFGEEKNDKKNSFNLVCPDEFFSPDVPYSAAHMGSFWDFIFYFALLVFRINGNATIRWRSRLSGFHWCLKYQKELKSQRKCQFFSQSHIIMA